MDMEEKIKNLEEQIQSLKDVIRISIPNLDSMLKDWKSKTGYFQSREF